ncbi:hypothetical protein K3495_g6776 [Podosphaera aphanis]|nr:hypothetical protein K3495_g6776 [Podosphaera aphanis]
MDSLQATCLSGATPVVLNPNGGCNLGFFCLNSSAENPPTYCAPTPECAEIRLGFYNNVCYQPQGTTEPIICAPGYFCSDGGKSINKCPSGYHCPLGSYKPIKCGILSICPAGSSKELLADGLLIIFIIDLFLLFLMFKPSKLLARMVQNASQTKLYRKHISRIRMASIDTEQAGGSRSSSINEDEEFMTDKSSLSRYLASVKRCVESNEVGMSFGFKNISRVLDNGIEIIASQSGFIEKGTLWGVMGGSGAGKTSFVNLIMGKTRPSSGTTYVNEAPCNISRFKSLIGYVPQDDVLMGELTVRENIMHSARTRLPSTWTNEECKVHVDALISCLGLTHVQHHRVGNAVKSHISGGQRKRVSIGVELAAAPMAIFLDEPTSGLDSTAALSIIRLLKTVSEIGVTVICIIHQPRLEILETLDGIHLLGRGCLLYHGEVQNLSNYFGSMGFPISDKSNVADAVLDIVSDLSTILDKDGQRIDVKDMARNWGSKTDGKLFQEKSSAEAEKQFAALIRSSESHGATWILQAKLCFLRSMKQQWRQKKSFVFEIGVGSACGFLLGFSLLPANGVHFQGIFNPPFQLLSSALKYDLLPQLSLFTCLAISLAAAAPGVKTFSEEKLIYWREASSGQSRSAYYVGKVISTLPRIAISAMHYNTFFYLVATPLITFWKLYILNFTYFYCIYGLSSIPSMLVRREDGPSIALIFSLIIAILNGYGPQLTFVKSWHLEWFWRTSPGLWYTEAFFNENTKVLGYLYDLKAAETHTGYISNRFGMDLSMMLLIGFLYRVAAYFGLIFMDRDKQR